MPGSLGSGSSRRNHLRGTFRRGAFMRGAFRRSEGGDHGGTCSNSPLPETEPDKAAGSGCRAGTRRVVEWCLGQGSGFHPMCRGGWLASTVRPCHLVTNVVSHKVSTANCRWSAKAMCGQGWASAIMRGGPRQCAAAGGVAPPHASHLLLTCYAGGAPHRLHLKG